MSRVEVVGGGTPSAEELAAVAVALTVGPASAGASPVGGTGTQVPAWLRAALQEGVGGPRVATPADLEHPGGG